MPPMSDHILSSPQRLAREICAEIMATEDEIAEAIELAIAHERKRCMAIVSKLKDADAVYPEGMAMILAAIQNPDQ